MLVADAGVSVNELAARLERLERERKLQREENRFVPMRRKELQQKKYWVRGIIRRYMAVRQLLYGIRGIRFEVRNGGRENKMWDLPDVELMNLCLDVELAIESLAWTGKGREETNIGRQMRSVFIAHELEGEPISKAASTAGVSQSKAKAMWEHCLEDVWETLEDYDDERMRAREDFRRLNERYGKNLKKLHF